MTSVDSLEACWKQNSQEYLFHCLFKYKFMNQHFSYICVCKNPGEVLLKTTEIFSLK